MMLHKVKFKKRREPSSSPSRTSSTFTTDKNPHLTKSKLHSKSTYFYRWGSRLNYVVPSVCSLALLVGIFTAVSPMIDNKKAYADENTMTVADPVINLTVAPDSGNTNNNVQVGEVAYFSNTITVGGTGINKYYLTLSSPNGSTGNLIGRDNPAFTIGKVDTNTNVANFADNTWGYAVSTNINATNDSLSYNPVPSGTSNNNAVYLANKTGAPTASGDKYKLVFAAKLGNNMPSDHYKTNVYISAVANTNVITDLGFANRVGTTITKMQDITPSFCLDANIGDAGKLIDTRDGKVYWVAKLADGNCWMTQNIAYDGGGARRCTINFSNKTCSNWPSSGSTAYYAVGSHIDGDHTSVGNYYTWTAAVNGDTSSAETKQGICPTGWQLPTGNRNSTTNKSLGGLTSAYNIGNNDAGSTTLRNDPLYFIYSGELTNGKLTNSESIGFYWSSTPSSVSYAAYFLMLGASSVDLRDYEYFFGMSVRCVAQ